VRAITHCGIATHLAAAILLIAAVGCGGSASTSPSPASAPTPAPPSHNGSWSGSWENDTLYRAYVTFTVSGSQVTSAKVDALLLYMRYEGGNALTVRTCTSRMTSSGPVAITANTFEVTVASARTGGSAKLRGTFDSSTSASGQLGAFTITKGCDGESVSAPARQDANKWTAVKK
jgi:hypothetical protein